LFVFGSSLTSSFWNGAATYYRGIYGQLDALGYRVTFAEPDIYGRQEHRDLAGDPPYAACPIYRNDAELELLLQEAAGADVIIKHSGVGARDLYLEARIAAMAGPDRVNILWDVDAPATLAAMEADPHHALRALLPRFTAVLTYGGGAAVLRRYGALGARQCHAIYNGLDPWTHYPCQPDPAWTCDLLFLGHRLPDREERVQRYFFDVAQRVPEARLILAGEGWQGLALPPNVRYFGHAPTAAHNRLNASARLVLNLNRDSMADCGFSPPTRIFEAAGAGACVVTDAWPGIETFFIPGEEILVVESPEDLERLLRTLAPASARAIGTRMRRRALHGHSYVQRAAQVHAILQALGTGRAPGRHRAQMAREG